MARTGLALASVVCVAHQARPGQGISRARARAWARMTPPAIAAAPQAAAPISSASRGLSAPTAPMIVAPIGVLPTNAVDHSAVTRPRYGGAAAIWIVLLPVVRKMMLANPTTSNSGTAASTLPVIASRASPACSGTATAAIIDLAPADGRSRATLLSTIAEMGGLGLGPLLAGVVATLVVAPLKTPF